MQYCILKEITEISNTIRDMKDEGVIMPITTLFNSPIWLLKMDGSLRIAVGYFKINHVVFPIALDIVNLLEPINTSIDI